MRRDALRALLAAVITTGAPGVVFAQGGDGYLFKEPRITLEFESGYGFQRAQSDIYDFVIKEHTLGRRDFDGPYLGGELGVRLSERVDLSLAIGYQWSSTTSEFRDYVDQDFLPIIQTTELSQLPVVVSLKVYPFERGRTIGRFAWVPRSIVPFVGAGVGVVSYDFEQYGDFIDFETDDIFYDEFDTSDDAFLARASAGVNISLGKQFLFTVEGRYGWADGDVDGDFVGFDPIDLDGLQLIGGLAVLF